MSRWLALAALGAAFLTIPAWAQRHGGGFAGGGGHAGFSSHGAVGGMHGPVMGGHSLGGFSHGGLRAGGGFHQRPFGNRPGFFPGRPFYHHRHFYPGYYGYGYAYAYPWWGWYGDYGYDSHYYTDDQDYSADSYAQEDYAQQQQAEIDRLTDEVAQLREQRETRNSNPQPSAARVWTDTEMTRLVFRDKHTEEIRNYAIVGQTLWVFSEDRAEKIMLAELDLPATEKANEEHGVEFQIPR